MKIVLSVLFFIGGGLCNTCDKGPYFYDGGCFEGEGFGSSVNHFKFGLILANLFNLTYLPNPKCFQSIEHHTNYLQLFDWESAAQCTSQQLTITRNLGPLELYSDGRNQLLSIEDESLRHVYYTVNGSDLAEKELKTICHDLESGKSLQRDLAEFSAIGRRGLFSQTRWVTSLFSSPKTVFIIQRPYLSFALPGYHCTRSFIAKSFWNKAALDSMSGVPRATLFDNRIASISASKHRQIRIGFHFRAGDVLTSNVNIPNERSLPMNDAISAIKNILRHPKSVLFNVTSRHSIEIAINFFSEGNLSHFQSFVDAFPTANMYLGNETSYLSDLDQLCSCDVIIGGVSSFATLAAAISQQAVHVVPVHSEKYWGISSVVAFGKVTAGNLADFNEKFCVLE